MHVHVYRPHFTIDYMYVRRITLTVCSRRHIHKSMTADTVTVCDRCTLCAMGTPSAMDAHRV